MTLLNVTARSDGWHEQDGTGRQKVCSTVLARRLAGLQACDDVPTYRVEKRDRSGSSWSYYCAGCLPDHLWDLAIEAEDAELNNSPHP